MEWIKYSKYNLPPQGMKVLCFRKGDMWVAQRFDYKGKDVWIPIPYTDSQLANTDPPDYWVQVEFPEGYKGFMQMQHDNGPLMFLDEYQEKFPEDHAVFVKMILDSMHKPKKSKE
jgi:hypothetical protein